jgi:hypothetical protein
VRLNRDAGTPKTAEEIKKLMESAPARPRGPRMPRPIPKSYEIGFGSCDRRIAVTRNGCRCGGCNDNVAVRIYEYDLDPMPEITRHLHSDFIVKKGEEVVAYEATRINDGDCHSDSCGVAREHVVTELMDACVGMSEALVRWHIVTGGIEEAAASFLAEPTVEKSEAMTARMIELAELIETGKKYNWLGKLIEVQGKKA